MEVCGCIKNLYKLSTNKTTATSLQKKKEKNTSKAKPELPKKPRTKQQQQKSLPHNMCFNRNKLWALVKGVPCVECSCLWKMAVL